VDKSRRNFLKSSASVTAAAMLPVFDFAHLPKFEQTKVAAGFELLFLATNWGYPGSMDEFCKAAKDAGYDGAELWMPATADKQQEMFDALKKYGLQVGFLCTGKEATFNEHFAGFKKNLDTIIYSPQKPLYVNCHSGKDHFSFDQATQIINYTIALSKQSGIPIYHETHRTRILYSAVTAKHFMDTIPQLRLTLDISHWCVVHESLLEEMPDVVAQALDRADHIHSRVGHAEGPQVSDPRAPEWNKALETHLQWWDKVIARKKSKGERMTILTEFGPPDYMPTLPYTRQPLGDQWAINVHMKNLLKERYLAR
jgi:sugar phosphate isomerase/epimerase